MSTPTSWTRATTTRTLSLMNAVFVMLRIYLLPAGMCAAAASVWLTVIAWTAESTRNSVLVLALVALPGIIVMALSRRERRHHWHEYALVWLAFATAVPVYGVVLLIGGYGIVGARAWRRRWPHALQDKG